MSSDHESENSYDEEHLTTPSESPKIPLVSAELDVVINGKSGFGYDKRALDLNLSYDEFLARLDTIVASKRKLSVATIQSSRKPLRYWWLRVTQTNVKTKAMPNLIDDEDNYERLQLTVADTAKTKPELENMVLRITIDLMIPEHGQAIVSADMEFDFITARSVKDCFDDTDDRVQQLDKELN